MRTLDVIAAALFFLWIFGFIHILAAMGIVAALQGFSHKHDKPKQAPLTLSRYRT
jgi:hypothetical protein